MNDITLPTMTKQESDLFKAQGQPLAPHHVVWWLPPLVLSLLFVAVLSLVALASFGRPTHATRTVPISISTVTINPSSINCSMRRELLSAGWKPVASDAERHILATDRHKRLIPSPTLTCVDTASCNGKPAGCVLTTFQANQWWYETARLPARRVSAE